MTARQDDEVPVDPDPSGTPPEQEPAAVREPADGAPAAEEWQSWLPEWVTAPVPLGPPAAGAASTGADEAIDAEGPVDLAEPVDGGGPPGVEQVAQGHVEAAPSSWGPAGLADVPEDP